ncbi:MAG: RNA polymerase sigma-70 factor [Bacteroidota bacterium]
MKIVFNKNRELKASDNSPKKTIHGAKDFEDFYNKSIKKLIYIAYQIVGDKEIAEGVVHDILIDIWERRKEIVITVSLEAYAIKAVKFKSFDHLKKRLKTEKLQKEILHSNPTFHNNVEEKVNVQELQTKVNHLTNLLPTRCQEVFRLSREKRLSNKEIARGLQISEKAVEKHISKAIRHLRLGLEKF